MKIGRLFGNVRVLFVLAGLTSGSFATAQDKSVDAASDVQLVQFSNEVREDFFAGFDGDEERLKSGIAKCEEVLSKNNKHAEAMVWLGAGEIFMSGQLFAKGNIPQGLAKWQKGLANMDKAVELEPLNIGVLIPRAAVLMPSSRNLPSPIKEQVLNRVLKDFNRVYETQKEMLDQIGEHPLGELRMGLADVYRSLGEQEKSVEQLKAVIEELPKTEYSARAETWLAAMPTAALTHNCIGCHTK